MTTTLAAATAGFVWAMVEALHKGKPSILGFCSGIVAGLVVITPACGFVDPKGAMIIGVLAGIIPYLAVMSTAGKCISSSATNAALPLGEVGDSKCSVTMPARWSISFSPQPVNT